MRDLNIKQYVIETSADGQVWVKVEQGEVADEDFTDRDVEPHKARYVRLVVDKCGTDDVARIADIEIHGKKIN